MFCSDVSAPIFLILSKDIPGLVYYSHLPAALSALLLGTFVLLKAKGSLPGKMLFLIAISFSTWVFLNLLVWANIDSRIVMFSWSLVGLAYLLTFIFSFYFFEVFVLRQDVSFWKKMVLGTLLVPIIFLTPSSHNLTLFSLVNCEAEEGSFFYNYYYIASLFIFFWILVVAVLRFQKERDVDTRRQILLAAIGVEFFLLLFFIAGYVSSLIDDFHVEQYGLFGMPVFMALLAYLIVRYKAFDIKLLGAQALIVSLVLIIGSQLFFVRNTTNFILTQIALILIIIAGYVLIRSIKSEMARKDELQMMADKLAIANENLRQLDTAKSEFISIASHQLRTPLTAMKGFISLLLEGSYGKLTPRVEDTLNKVYSSNERLIYLVEDLLNLSRIEAGRMEYTLESVHVEDLLKELYATFSVITKQKNLQFALNIPEAPLPTVRVDFAKTREVVSNLIDNAIKYTEKGSVSLSASLSGNGNFVRVEVRDTGVGILAQDLETLFQKFSRGKDPSRLHANGTGLGLYVGKKMIEDMGGRILVTSESQDKGSCFAIEIPRG